MHICVCIVLLSFSAKNFNKHAYLLTYTENIVNIRDTQMRQWPIISQPITGALTIE